MAQILVNNASGVVAAGGFAQSATLLPLTDASAFPDPGADWYLVTLADAAETEWEIVQVTAKSGNNLTVVRAQEGTSDIAWDAGDKVEARLTAGTLESVPTAVQPASTDTLTNKTINAAANTITNIGEGQLTAAALAKLQLAEDTRVFGFLPGTSEVTLAFNPATYELSLTPTASDWSYYRNGIKHTITGAKTVTLPGSPPAANTYFVYIDDDAGTLTASTTPWGLGPSDTKVFVAEIEWNDALTPKFLLYSELHLCDLTRGEHAYLHYTQGAKYKSGADISGYTLDSSASDADIRFDIAASEFYDETLVHTLSSFTAGVDNYIVRYRSGGDWLWEESAVPFTVDGSSVIEYDNAGTLTPVSPNYHANAWLILSPSGYQIIAPQSEHAALAGVQGENFGDLTLTGAPAAEFVAAYKLTYEHKTTYGTTGEVRLVAVERISVSSIPAASGSYDSAGTAAAEVDAHELAFDHSRVGTTSVVTYSGTAPVSPNTGDQWVNAGVEYTWNGTRWVQTSLIAGSVWDGDIVDIDASSSADIGEALADDDQSIVYNTSGTAWVRFAWSRVWTYITDKIAAATALALGGFTEKGSTGLATTGTVNIPADGGNYSITTTGDITPTLTSLPTSPRCGYATLEVTIGTGHAILGNVGDYWGEDGVPTVADGEVWILALYTMPSGNVHIDAVKRVALA